MAEYPKMEAIMDEAYKGFTDQMSQRDFYASLKPEVLKVVLLGNLNYQVTNGGFLQWYDNGYYVGSVQLQRVLVQMDTTEAMETSRLVSRCLRLVRDNSGDCDLVSELDDAFYKINETLLAQMEASLPEPPMKVFPSAYDREDGKVCALKTRDGWVLRSISGPSWFWNQKTLCWDISTAGGFDLHTSPYLMTEEEALKLLPALEAK